MNEMLTIGLVSFIVGIIYSLIYATIIGLLMVKTDFDFDDDPELHALPELPGVILIIVGLAFLGTGFAALFI